MNSDPIVMKIEAAQLADSDEIVEGGLGFPIISVERVDGVVLVVLDAAPRPLTRRYHDDSEIEVVR